MKPATYAVPLLLVAAVGAGIVTSTMARGGGVASARSLDVVCHMEAHPGWGHSATYRGRAYSFCTEMCKRRFEEDPRRYLDERCLVCNEPLAERQPFGATYLGKTYALCSAAHREAFQADPAAYFLHTMWGIPSWLYQSSIAVVLVLSFGLFEWLGRRRRSTGSAQEPATLAPDRRDLFAVPWIRAALLSRGFRFSLQAVIVALFLLIVAAGLLGNQNPALNIAPILTWTIWWGLLPVFIVFAGKFWCYVCPWDAVAGWAERLAFWRKPAPGSSLGLDLKWPRIVRNVSIATILFLGLTWIELGFGVTMSPRVTAWLAVGMLLLAVVSALTFDRRSFCRYGCLVGRVSGLYALFAGVEVRARSSATCDGCRTKECVRGSTEAYGCPTFLYPGKLDVNTYCIQCMECVQACPHDNLALNARPLGSDLVAQGRPRADEAYLALLMLAITGFHGLTMTPLWRPMTEALGGKGSAGKMVGFTLGMFCMLAAPIAIYALLVELSRRLSSPLVASGRRLGFRDYFVQYAYCLLPIALFYHIAHNLEHLLMEGPRVLAMVSDPFGWGWNLFGTATWSVPPLISLDRLWLVQAFFVLVGHVYSLWIAQRTSSRLFGDRRAALRSQLPMLAGMILFSVFSLWLLKQPMEMRTSAM